jgi:hypothetical protein
MVGQQLLQSLFDAPLPCPALGSTRPGPADCQLLPGASAGVDFHVCEPNSAPDGKGAGTLPRDDCVPLHVEEGLVFELNNRLSHYVHNNSDQVRPQPADNREVACWVSN